MRNKCFSYSHADIKFDFSEIDQGGSSISMTAETFLLCGCYPYKIFEFAVVSESDGPVNQRIAFISADIGTTDQYLAETFTFKELRKIAESLPTTRYRSEMRISSKKLLVNDLARILSSVVSELASIEAAMRQLPKCDYNHAVSKALRKITRTGYLNGIQNNSH